MLIECEKCGRGFIPEEEEIVPIISGFSRRPIEEKGSKCPYCGQIQKEHRFSIGAL